MSFGQASNSLSLLGQQGALAARKDSPSTAGPQFEVRWNSFHQSLGSSIHALFTGPTPRKNFVSKNIFRDCSVEGRIPRTAVTAAALWHIVFLLAPWPDLPATPRKNPAFENFQLTWSGPINDFPPLKLSSAPAPARAIPSPRGDAAKPLAREGAEAFHPHQRIFTDPIAPTHPRQTLINTAARIVPPKILPSLPNIVLLQQSAVPSKPRMEITEQMLAQLHPREHRTAAVKAAPLPDVPVTDGPPAEITLAVNSNAPARPKLELNAGTAPRVAQQRSSSNDAGPAPELAHQNSMDPNASTLIALSATPGPVAPSAPPQGNLVARVSISPEGKQPGVPGGKSLPENNNGGLGGAAESRGGSASENIAGTNSTTVSISGGNPTPKNMSALSVNPQPKIDSPTPHRLVSKIDPRARIADAPERTGPPNFAALPPGAKPEQVFAAKKMYTMLVNMPNLNSATGSWILNFSELRSSSSAPHVTSADLSGPSPVKKSDPRYPPTLINEHVEGEVVLYAVIRADGSVDSVELVRGLDAQLDANAMEALSQWKFRPASRQGTPVDLEAIVHIPFRAPSNDN
ncbi:MAG TPA: TonB family protein [Methylomirabilota bacterium]|nr:TonB family protein [Methylomirabilota bacterium]